MQVELLHYTPLIIGANAIRTCYQSFDKGDNGGAKDCDLIDRVGNKMRHSSTLEHLFYNFYIKGISRACLQELARHRMASYSVKSTRYTLKELRNESEFKVGDFSYASKYLVLTNNEMVDNASILALENLRKILNEGVAMDIAKFCLPESYKTELTWSINARSLQNFLNLRSSASALWEIRALANAAFNALPPEQSFIFVNCMNQNNN